MSILAGCALANAVFLATLAWLAKRGADDRATAVRVLIAWGVVCPLIGAAVAWIARGLTGDTSDLGIPGLSPWSFELNTHFMTQAAVRALVAVASAAWILVRASVRRPAPM